MISFLYAYMETRLFTSDFEARYILLSFNLHNNINHHGSTNINILSNTKEATSTEGDEKKYKGGEHTIGRISEL